jgi:uncharacterized protein
VPPPLLSPPFLTLETTTQLDSARQKGASEIPLSVDLGKSDAVVSVGVDSWAWREQRFPYPGKARAHTVYGWNGVQFEPIAIFDRSLVKLVPTQWGPPTFEIDGIKMLVSAHISPLEDARRKVSLVEPAGKRVLDCCGGLGYFAYCCLAKNAHSITSFEKNESVLWIRAMNPWSPTADPRLTLRQEDIAERIVDLPAQSFDAVLHDPPRFGIAGELYSQLFYDELSRVLEPGGLLFHYTGSPNKLTSGRNVPLEVTRRLQQAGFTTRIEGDGILARKGRRR